MLFSPSISCNDYYKWEQRNHKYAPSWSGFNSEEQYQ